MATGFIVESSGSNRSSTLVETLFTFWPPGPEARTATQDMDSAGSVSVESM